MTTATLRKVAGTTHDRSSTQSALRERAQRLMQVEIDFIPNAEFEEMVDVDDSFVETTLAQLRGSSNAPADLPAHLRRMCESDLLTQDQETALFRHMNFLKFRADSLRVEVNFDDVDPCQLDSIESLLRKSNEIRDHIIQANMRLVMAIVKKFVTPQQSFDDMLSDGIYTLMQAVEKFDYDRGFRFSTYAYRSIARNAYRSVTSARKEDARYTRDAEDWAFEQEDDRRSSTMGDQVWSNLRDLATGMLDKLDRRERFIIRSRYALGAHRKVRTFQDLANKLGVSKERVRQLEQRAVTKLQNMAAEIELDEILTASMV